MRLGLGHTSRPGDFSWAPGVGEQWHIASVSEDNVLMVWQPSRRIWAAEDVEVDERELEADAMEGVENAGAPAAESSSAALKPVAASGSSGSNAKSRGSTVSRSEGEIEE